MNINEEAMKKRGEAKVWSTIKTKNGGIKTIASTQLGQHILLEDALNILPKIKLWIESGSAKIYRRQLKEYFSDEDFVLQKITESLLLLSGAIHTDGDSKLKRGNRHKRVNTIRNKTMPQLSFEMVWRFLEVVIEQSAYFNVEKLMHYDKDGFCWSIRYTSLLSDAILDKLSLEAIEAFYPLPMTERPLDWHLNDDGKMVGGYRTHQSQLIRASRDVDYSLYSKKVLDSINYIQSTGWLVNNQLLDQVIADLKMPYKSDFIKAQYPDGESSQWKTDLQSESCEMTKDQKATVESFREEFREAADLYNAEVGDYESAMGKYRAIKMATQIAQKYQNQVIYFPHSFDFRGRVYPIPVGLSPQGSDAIKSMLQYQDGERLDQNGAKWGFAYLASLYGDDKLDFELRVDRGMELINADYKDADEPYQFLAHQIELQKVVEDPKAIFRGRVHLDACNSGSQFTSAITGDKAGCEATNVLPTINQDGSQQRKDAYLLVAQRSLELIIEQIDIAKTYEQRERLEFFKKLMIEQGRKVCKTPVMVSNYGGTAGGRSDILWNMFREMKVERKWITKKVSSNLAKIVGDSIVGVLNGGKAFEKYIHQMNNIIAQSDKAIWWTTSDGFHVVHIKNKELKSKQVSCLLPGSRKNTTIIMKVFSDKVSIAKMKSAISPNVIHSYDAELLRRVALKMRNAGVESTDWIHDSFGCHPNYINQMLEITKYEFSKFVKRVPLRTLDKELRSQMESKKKRDVEILDKISIPQLRGFNVAQGGLDSVLQSDWFFS